MKVTSERHWSMMTMVVRTVMMMVVAVVAAVEKRRRRKEITLRVGICLEEEIEAAGKGGGTLIQKITPLPISEAHVITTETATIIVGEKGGVVVGVGVMHTLVEAIGGLIAVQVVPQNKRDIQIIIEVMWKDLCLQDLWMLTKKIS
jgi:hypothetical protein